MLYGNTTMFQLHRQIIAPHNVKTTLTIYCNPWSSGTFVVSDQENTNWDQENTTWDPTLKIPKTLPCALYSPKRFLTWAKYKKWLIHATLTFILHQMLLDFVILSSQTWNLTPHWKELIISSVLLEMLSDAGAGAVMLWMRGRIQQCFCTNTDSCVVLTP